MQDASTRLAASGSCREQDSYCFAGFMVVKGNLFTLNRLIENQRQQRMMVSECQQTERSAPNRTEAKCFYSAFTSEQ